VVPGTGWSLLEFIGVYEGHLRSPLVTISNPGPFTLMPTLPSVDGDFGHSVLTFPCPTNTQSESFNPWVVGSIPTGPTPSKT
jgi:hypothetical protein